MTTQAAFSSQSLPFHWRIGALQDAKDAAFLLKNSLHATSRKHKEALKFAKMKQTHHRIYIGARQEHATNRGWRRSILRRRKFVRAEHLLPQIRRSAE